MTTSAKIRQRKNVLRQHRTKMSADVWMAICGMWKGRKINAVGYQKRLRKEADSK